MSEWLHRLILYTYRGHDHGPPIIRRVSELVSHRLTTWQTVVVTMLWLYIARNFDRLFDLECPEPLANLYTRSYFRATWVTTALDAGFWSAMRIKRKWARNFFSMVFSFYYLLCAEQADQKVRRVRATLSVDHLRVSWNKGTTPYLAFIARLLRPRLMRYPPRAIRIPRPPDSAYREPVLAWLYFDRPLSALRVQSKLVLDIPGGGWVAMDPRKHDDKLMAWAAKTGLPVLSLDYGKAPEYPYPYALNECYDVYHMIVSSRGRCVGFSGESRPRIVVSGDSAGGNLAVGMTLMILQSGSLDTRQWPKINQLPPPEGIVLIYPALDMNIGNWMSEEKMALIQDRRSRKTNKCILRRKSEDYRQLDPNTPHHSDDDDEPNVIGPDQSIPPYVPHNQSLSSLPEQAMRLSAPQMSKTGDGAVQKLERARPQTFRTRLAMSSILSYFNDRILTPEMMRSMIILYIGPHHRPDFSLDYLLSPILAPEQLLARFPKTYFLTGERDPLVDDTVIFAGRIRQAKLGVYQERKDFSLLEPEAKFADEDHVEVLLVPGISHGFLQFVGVFPEGWNYIFRAARWMREAFDCAGHEAADSPTMKRSTSDETNQGYRQKPELSAAFLAKPEGELKVHGPGRHHRRTTTENSADYDRPLEITKARSSRVKKAKDPNITAAVNVASLDHRQSSQLDSCSGIDGLNRNEKAKIRSLGPGARKRSLVSLASEEDLLGRRMKGVTGGLIGADENGIPPTPGEKTPDKFF